MPRTELPPMMKKSAMNALLHNETTVRSYRPETIEFFLPERV